MSCHFFFFLGFSRAIYGVTSVDHHHHREEKKTLTELNVAVQRLSQPSFFAKINTSILMSNDFSDDAHTSSDGSSGGLSDDSVISRSGKVVKRDREESGSSAQDHNLKRLRGNRAGGDIENLNAFIKETQASIISTNTKIESVEGQIADISTQIADISTQIASKTDPEERKQLMKKEEQLMKKEEQLRTEKQLLMKKEEQLRAEKQLYLESLNARQNELHAFTSPGPFAYTRMGQYFRPDQQLSPSTTIRSEWETLLYAQRAQGATAKNYDIPNDLKDEPDETDLLAKLAEGSVVDLDIQGKPCEHGLSVVQGVTLDTLLDPDSFHSSFLLIRNFYCRLIQRVLLASDARRFALIGNPGISKSFFHWYVHCDQFISSFHLPFFCVC